MEHVGFDGWMRGRVELVAAGLLAALLGRAWALVGGGEEGSEAVPETRACYELLRRHLRDGADGSQVVSLHCLISVLAIEDS